MAGIPRLPSPAAQQPLPNLALESPIFTHNLRPLFSSPLLSSPLLSCRLPCTAHQSLQPNLHLRTTFPLPCLTDPRLLDLPCSQQTFLPSKRGLSTFPYWGLTRASKPADHARSSLTKPSFSRDMALGTPERQKMRGGGTNDQPNQPLWQQAHKVYFR